MRNLILGFYQEKAVELGLDLKDLMILRYLADFINSNSMTKITIENKTFYWVKYEALQKELPILEIKNKNVLRRRLKVLEEKKVLEHYHMLEGGSFSYYALGENFEELVSKKNSDGPKNGETKKENEKKETEIDEVIDEYTANDSLKKAIKEFVKFRKSVKATVTTFSLKKILSKLSKIASLDEEKIAVIENSLINGWKNVFPLKQTKENTSSLSKFNNFTPREYDYDSLERQLLGYE